MSTMLITKRDGRKVPFTKDRILYAMRSAFNACDIDINTDELNNIYTTHIKPNLNYNDLTVEGVQDIVEKALMSAGYPEVAKHYILYRQHRSEVRLKKNKLIIDLKEITTLDAKDSNLQRENANINGDTAMGCMLRRGSTASKFLYTYDDSYMPRDVAEAHKNGDIHIHDLDFLTDTTTCTQIPLGKLLKNGFSTGHGSIRQPQDIITASSLTAIVIQSNQNDQHGGQSIPMLDYDLALYVAKSFAKNIVGALYFRGLDEDTCKVIKKSLRAYVDEHTHIMNEDGYVFLKSYLVDAKHLIKEEEFDTIMELAKKKTNYETFQAMEGLIHNLNTMNSRAGAQVPFSSINYGTDTSEEGRMIIKNVLLATEAGLGNGETPIFPIHIFKCKDGINFNDGDPNYDLFLLACRVTAKRLFPNFSILDAPFNLQYYKPGCPDTEIAYMGCRTRVMANNYDKDREIVTGRGNLSFTSINLPRLGIEAHGDINKFYEMLDEKLDLVVKQLLSRFEIQASKHVYNYPFLMEQGVWIDSDKLKYDDEVREVLKHGTLTAGFIGLAETLIALTGKHHGESEESQKLGLEIVAHMRKRMDEECEKTGLNFSLIATPAEGLSGRFVNMDRAKYGEIPGITDREYYTNSFHVPVYYNIQAADKISIEGPYHELTNGGHISYVELDGDPTKNVAVIPKLLHHMRNCGIGYGSINHPVDSDPVCGFTGIINDVCPKCGRREYENGPGFNRIRRITGYLVGTLERFNDAKRAEVRDRVKHI